MQDDLARLAADVQIGQDHRLGGGVVPVVAGGLLVVPDVFAGIRIERDDGGQVEVVAAGRAAFAARPGRAVAGAHIHQVELGVEGQRVPRGAAATGFPVFAGWVPGLGRLGHRLILERLARVAGHGEPAPFLLAGAGIVGGDIAAHAILRPAVADDDLALEHARRAGDGVRVAAVDDGVLLPQLAAGAGIERDQAAIIGSDKDLALVQRHAAIDHIAAALEADRLVDLRVEGPDALAVAGVDGMHHAPRCADVHDAVDHQRRGFHPTRGFEIVGPGQPEVLHVVGIDLREPAEAGFRVVQAVAGPVGCLGGVGFNEGAVDATGDGTDVIGAGHLGRWLGLRSRQRERRQPRYQHCHLA